MDLFTAIQEAPTRKPVITWANITCGEDCWNAVCEDCKCSCGGVNHGIYKRTGKRPDRTCREGAQRYKLAAVVHFAGCDLFKRSVEQYMTRIALAGPLRYMSKWGSELEELETPVPVHEGYPLKLKCCSPSQLKWPEFQNAVTPTSWSSKQEKCNEANRSMFYGLWVSADAPADQVAAAIKYANERQA